MFKTRTPVLFSRSGLPLLSTRRAVCRVSGRSPRGGSLIKMLNVNQPRSDIARSAFLHCQRCHRREGANYAPATTFQKVSPRGTPFGICTTLGRLRYHSSYRPARRLSNVTIRTRRCTSMTPGTSHSRHMKVRLGPKFTASWTRRFNAPWQRAQAHSSRPARPSD
jgi:hypothetical protein